MKNIKTTTFATIATLQERMTALLADTFCAATNEDYAVVLSGGNTPLPVYEALSKQTATASKHVHVCLSDERHVPYDDPQNNASYLLPMLKAFDVPNDQFLRVDTRQSLQQAADQFDQGLRHWQNKNMRYPLGILGIGTDGHTASLFSAENVAQGAGHLAIPVTRPMPPDRISTTPEFLQQIERIIILAAGSSKQSILYTLKNEPETIPCGLALNANNHVEIWTTE